jgi:hypothetical protein
MEKDSSGVQMAHVLDRLTVVATGDCFLAEMSLSLLTLYQRNPYGVNMISEENVMPGSHVSLDCDQSALLSCEAIWTAPCPVCIQFNSFIIDHAITVQINHLGPHLTD